MDWFCSFFMSMFSIAPLTGPTNQHLKFFTKSEAMKIRRYVLEINHCTKHLYVVYAKFLLHMNDSGPNTWVLICVKGD